MLKRAIISVFDKTGVLELCQFLKQRNVEIISTGGTLDYLAKNGIAAVEASELTGFPEMLDGRVKTLHPKIHGGILAIRDNEKHMEQLKKEHIEPIDMVVVNLYPFFSKASDDSLSFEEKVEFIDIGGPTMLRAAAKNYQDVLVISDVMDYKDIMKDIEEQDNVDIVKRRKLAGKVFNLMASYDAAVSNFFLDEGFPEHLSLSYTKVQNLRYGENPHQKAAYYVPNVEKGALSDFQLLNGKELSYNNIKDMDIAWKVSSEFEEPFCCALKHNSPCGAATGNTLRQAYLRAFQCDEVSIFGGIVSFNRSVDSDTARELVKIFLEVIIAPDFDEDALEILKQKKNLRVVKCHRKPQADFEIAKVDGGILLQDCDNKLMDELNYVTEKQPTEKEMEDMIFGMKIVKYVKSNAIVVVKDKMAKGIGGGQVNRIWAAAEALDRAKDGVVIASDAFFPFGDIVEEAAKYNIKAIIQPGGSIRDNDSIDGCNKHNIAMVFSGIRHFKH